MHRLGTLVAFTALALPALAAAAPPATAHRPRVGLVLSGGGARGFAHIGVLEALEQLHVRVDAVAGTSMGAVVGGLYAAGYSPAQLRYVVEKIDWSTAFDDTPPRRDLSFRRKQDDFDYLTNLRLYLKNWGIALPKGLIEGQKISNILASLAAPVATVRDFDALFLPFRAVATDAVTGEAVVLSDGELARALRASMAIPGIFSPVDIEGQLLVDGGVVDNLPVDVAKAMGVDVVIAVDIGTNPADTREVGSVISISGQILSVLMHKNTLAARALLGKSDVLIAPDLGTITAASFERGPEAIERGAEAARAAAPALERLAVDDEAWAGFEARRREQPQRAPVVDQLRFDNSSGLSTQVIERRVHVPLGEPLDVWKLRAELDALYGEGVFDRVYFSIDDVAGQNELVIHSDGKETGNTFLRFGLKLETNFQGESQFDVGALVTTNPVDSLGGEWRTQLQIGDDTLLRTEFFQPLDYASRFFVAPELEGGIGSFNEFSGSVRIAELESQSFAVRLAAGVQPTNWSELRAGLGYSAGRSRIIVGSPLASEQDFGGGRFFGRLTLDTLDDVRFPRSGGLLRAEAEYQTTLLGSPTSFGTASVSGLYALSFGENTISPTIRVGTTFENEQRALPEFQLGGFLSLSGLAPGERSGRELLFASLIGYRRLANPRFFTLALPLYVGASIEAGNTFQRRSEIAFDRMLVGGSAFVGLDTPLGPIYVAYGLTEGGRQSGYFFLGQRF